MALGCRQDYPKFCVLPGRGALLVLIGRVLVSPLVVTPADANPDFKNE